MTDNISFWEHFLNYKELSICTIGFKQAVHCKTKREAKLFCKMLHEHGRKWCDGSSYLSTTEFYYYGDNSYYTNDGHVFGGIYVEQKYIPIYEFHDIFPINIDFQTIKQRGV